MERLCKYWHLGTGVVAHQVELPLGMSVSSIIVLGLSPGSIRLLIQFLLMCLGGSNDGASAWIPVVHMGDLDGVPSS